MGYYPIFVELTGRRCVVIGGGLVAEKKVAELLAAGACVTVISPTITDGLREFLAQGSIFHVERAHQEGDLVDYELVFAATDDPNVNAKAFREARSRRIWINSADDPAHCDFILPGVVRRGALTVAVSTGGASPAATRAIREELENYFTADYASFVQIASEARRQLREKSLSVSGARWNQALKGNFRRLIREGRAEDAKKVLLETLEAWVCV
jgi:precorrin-2 dehydrogenase / sirohydrochlorin ferrochelatase